MALHATYAYVLTLGVLPFSYSAPKNRASGCVLCTDQVEAETAKPERNVST